MSRRLCYDPNPSGVIGLGSQNTWAPRPWQRHKYARQGVRRPKGGDLGGQGRRGYRRDPRQPSQLMASNYSPGGGESLKIPGHARLGSGDSLARGSQYADRRTHLQLLEEADQKPPGQPAIQSVPACRGPGCRSSDYFPVGTGAIRAPVPPAQGPAGTASPSGHSNTKQNC